MIPFRSLAAALALACAGAPAAHANPVSITNATEQPLNFKLRCKSPQVHDWKVFRTAVGESATINQHGCHQYSFEMTTLRRGMDVTVRYAFAGGTRHKLVYDRHKNAFDSRKLPGSPT